jgi:predicted dehydrogenase
MPVRARIALVGAGTMGSHHARVISQSGRATLSYVSDPREDVGRALADRYGAVWVPELAQLSDVDAVVVAAATEAHYDLAMDVLGQDRGLLIEKPVSDSLLKTREIVDAAGARDLPLMCGLLERYNPAVMTAHSLVTDPLHLVATRHSPYAPRIRTGVAWDLLIHDVDLAISFMGAVPISIDARSGFFHPNSAPHSEDVVETLLGFESGALAHVSASRVGQRKIRQLSIYEPDRLVEVDLLRRDVVIYRHVSENSVDDGRGYRQQTVIEIPEMTASQEPLAAQFSRFLDILDGRADAASERASILPPHEVIEAVMALKTVA